MVSRMPHPYTDADAADFVRRTKIGAIGKCVYAITKADTGAFLGCCGIEPHEDGKTVELGYWLGEAHWGRGVMTGAVRGFTEYAFGAFELCRIFAVVFEWNSASRRVLEKAGYELEGRMRRAAVKDGQVIDQFLYATVRDFDPEPPVGGAPQQSG